MSRVPERATTEGQVYLQIRLPGKLKNQVIDNAESSNVSLNAWLLQAIQNMLRDGMPAPAPLAPLPTHVDVLRAYLSGETLMGPCGQLATDCDAVNGNRLTADMSCQWCQTCGIRLT